MMFVSEVPHYMTLQKQKNVQKQKGISVYDGKKGFFLDLQLLTSRLTKSCFTCRIYLEDYRI